MSYKNKIFIKKKRGGAERESGVGFASGGGREMVVLFLFHLSNPVTL